MKNIEQHIITFPLLQYTLSHVIQKLLSPIREYNIDDVLNQVSKSGLLEFTVDDYILSVGLSYDKNHQTIFADISRAICRSNKFLLVVDNTGNNDEGVLSFDFIEHEFNAVIDEVLHKKTYNNIPKELRGYISDLAFILSSKRQERDYPFVIEPLSKKNIDEAMHLQYSIFPNMSETEKLSLAASLSKEKYEDIYMVNNIKSMQYWVAKDPDTLRIIGLTGIYSETKDSEDECWLGWFCIDEKYRERRYGKELLQFSEEQAKALKKKTMHIYTYKTKKFQKAIELYKKFGYKQYLVKDTKYKRDLYFKKDLVQ